MNKPGLSAELSFSAAQSVKESDYWLKKLARPPAKTSFPYDRITATGGKINETFAPGTVSFHFPAESVSRIMKITGGFDVRLHMLLAAVVLVLLDKYTDEGTGDIIIGTPIYKQDIEGNFINTVLALRNQLHPGMSFKELLPQVRQTIGEAVENQNYPIESILYHLGIPFEETGNFPLFDTAVLLENIHDKSYLQRISLNMIFSFHSTGRELEGKVEYNPGCYHPDTIRRIVNHLVRLTRETLFRVDRPLDQADILSRQEKQQLLEEFNRTGAPYPHHKTIAQLFEEQVEKKPHQLALVGMINPKSEYRNSKQEGTKGLAPPSDLVLITYRELNERSNRLVGVLRKRGVKPGVIAALLMGRTVDMIEAILGVIKAGGAYLPLSPDTPLNRIRQTLEDANGEVLVTQSAVLRCYREEQDQGFTCFQNLHITRTTPYKTISRKPISDMDTLPMPDRSWLDCDKYTGNISLAMVKHCIPLQGTRGCPYSCAYCARLWPKKQVVRSAENLFSEVQRYYHMGIRRFSIIDDIFNLDVENSGRFFQLVRDHGLNLQLLFPAGLRGDIMTKDYIDLMVAAGTINISVALETASPRLQRLIRKNLDIEKLRENLRYICDRHPQVILDLFTMHGLPTETEEEAMKTLDFIKGFHWLHFPLINITRIYADTHLEKLALDSGITWESILKAENLAWHEAAETLPFDKKFTIHYQANFLENYFLKKERLLHVLPHQMNVLTEDEIALKYNSYLPIDNDEKLRGFDRLLAFLGIGREELGEVECVPEERFAVTDLNPGVSESFPVRQPDSDTFRVLLLDLSQSYSRDRQLLDELYDQPLGLLYLMTWLNQRFGNRIQGKIAKSGIDFDSDEELKVLLSEFKPRAIGIRTLTFYKDFFHRTAANLRLWGYDVPIIVGGPYATNGYNGLLQDWNIDLVVLAEGEITFAEVIEAIMDNRGQLPPEETLKKIPGIVFVPGKHRPERKPRLAWDILISDEMGESLKRESGENPEPLNHWSDPVYTIYTSGSSGIPKGVVIQHRNLHNLVTGLHERIYKRYPGHFKIAVISPYIFDASVKQIFGALLLGNTLYNVPEDIRMDGYRLLEYFEKHKIQVTDGTPTHLELLLASDMNHWNTPHLKHMLIGGEALNKARVEEFFRQYNGTPPVIANVYGPTECSVDTTSFDISTENIRHLEEIPIGMPMSNVQVYIVSSKNQLQPIGCPGELCIGGDGVGRGYLNQPELTAERFYHDGYHRSHRSYRSYISYLSYIYKTGDLARWLPDGNIRYLGRKDHQVKIRGYRLEPGEIEKALLKHKKIKHAVVVARTGEKNKNGDMFLCAYVVAGPGARGPGRRDDWGDTIDIAGLREFLSQTLPDYMIPSYFVSLAEIPLTPNGKIHREALPAPEIGETGDGYTAPQNHTQRVLAEIWADILKIEKEKISIDANFFELGGHSLKATILIARVHQVFDVRLLLARIFESPTIRGTAEEILKSEKTVFTDLVKMEKKSYYPLSFNQRRLWVIHQVDPASAAYNLSGHLNFGHAVDETLAAKVLAEIAMRHESFRTAFKIVNERPVQFILEHVDTPPRVVDISALEEEEKQSRRNEILAESAWTPFDLTRAPFFRSILIKLDNNHSQLIVTMHHIVSDGWSMEILRNEFLQLYEGYRSGKEARLEPVKFQYKDFAGWQNRQLANPVLKRRTHRFWKSRLEREIPTLDIPGDFRTLRDDISGAVWRFVISKELLEKLKKLAETYHTTLFTVMFTGYTLILSRFSHQKDVVCSIIHSGREHVGLYKIIGFFVNSLIFTTWVDDDEPFSNFLQRTTSDILEVFQHQEYPTELVFEELKTRYPNIPVSFNLLNMQEETTFLEVETFEMFHSEGWGEVKFDIETYFIEFKNGIEVYWTYKRKLFKPETMNYMIGEYIKILEYFTVNTDKNCGSYRHTGKKKSIWETAADME